MNDERMKLALKKTFDKILHLGDKSNNPQYYQQ